jgi:hypothetical protein
VESVLPSQLTNSFISALSLSNDNNAIDESINTSYTDFTSQARQQSRHHLDSSFEDFGVELMHSTQNSQTYPLPIPEWSF